MSMHVFRSLFFSYMMVLIHGFQGYARCWEGFWGRLGLTCCVERMSLYLGVPRVGIGDLLTQRLMGAVIWPS